MAAAHVGGRYYHYAIFPFSTTQSTLLLCKQYSLAKVQWLIWPQISLQAKTVPGMSTISLQMIITL